MPGGVRHGEPMEHRTLLPAPSARAAERPEPAVSTEVNDAHGGAVGPGRWPVNEVHFQAEHEAAAAIPAGLVVVPKEMVLGAARHGPDREIGLEWRQRRRYRDHRSYALLIKFTSGGHRATSPLATGRPVIVYCGVESNAGASRGTLRAAAQQRRAAHHLLASGGAASCGQRCRHSRGRRRGIGRWARGGSRRLCLFVWIGFRSIVEVEIGADNLRTHYDLIVVGTGPAGLTLARKYEERTGDNVLVVESGRRSRENNAARKLSTVSATGDFPSAYYPLHNQRIFGGTSTVWNGWCAVLEKRSFLNNEWPFSYDELYAYYPEAAEILRVPEEVHTRPEVAFPGNANVVYRPFYFSPPVRFNELFEGWVNRNSNVDVLFNHSVMRVNINDYVAESILVQESSEGPTNPVEVFGSRIVLAAGGIQNARLLKISLSKESKNIGAYFCQHQYPLYFGGSIILDKDVLEKVIDRKNSRIAHAIALSSGFSKIHSIKSAVFSVSPQNHSAKNLLGQNKYTFTSGINIYAEMSSLVSNRSYSFQYTQRFPRPTDRSHQFPVHPPGDTCRCRISKCRVSTIRSRSHEHLAKGVSDWWRWSHDWHNANGK